MIIVHDGHVYFSEENSTRRKLCTGVHISGDYALQFLAVQALRTPFL